MSRDGHHDDVRQEITRDELRSSIVVSHASRVHALSGTSRAIGLGTAAIRRTPLISAPAGVNIARCLSHEQNESFELVWCD